jgi:hypothetical protein
MTDAPSPRRPVRWRPTDAPLTAVAVAAIGDAATALARRLLDRGDLASLRGVAGESLLVVLGAAESLPWCDGVIYLGQADGASGVLWPTTLQPDAPPVLVARALCAGVGSETLPLAVLPTHGLSVALGDARPIDADVLRAAFPGASA